MGSDREGIRQGKGSIRIRVVCENYAESYSGSIDRDRALAFFDLNEEIDNALEGLSGESFSQLTKISDEDDLITITLLLRFMNMKLQ